MAKTPEKKFVFEEEILRHKETRGPHTHDDLEFPKEFLWGAATSSHQVEGNNEFNDWHRFEQEDGNIYENQVSGSGPDHYHFYKEDFKIASETMHNNAHRLSLEWSRIEPQEDNYHQLHVEHYRHVLQDLKSRGMKVMLTLNHFTLPWWLYNEGGWLRHDAVERFEKFTRFCAKEYGEYVDHWVTINEPLVYTQMSYVQGEWPPAKNSYLQAYRVYRALIRAHKAAYKALHEELDTTKKKCSVGVAKSVITASSHMRHSLYGQLQEYFYDKVWNHSFMDATKGYHDFIGINYYLYQRLFKSHDIIRSVLDIRKEMRDSSDLGWEIYPQGIYEAIVDMSIYGLPIYITENGIATRNDSVRIRYLVSYLKEVFHAIERGLDVRGYFHWSLLDNFEWDKGYTPKFGFIGWDEKTLEREVKKSAQVYGEIARTNMISHDILKYIGHGVR